MLKTLRFQLKFLLPLAVAIVIASYVAVPLLDRVTLRWFMRDITARADLVANALSDSVSAALEQGDKARLTSLFTRTARDERIYAIGLCDARGAMIARTDAFPATLTCRNASHVASTGNPRLVLPGGGVLLTLHLIAPVGQAGASRAASGDLVLLHDLSFVERRSRDARQMIVGFLIVLGIVLASLTMLVAHLSLHGWMRGVRAVLRGDPSPASAGEAPELAPLLQHLRARLREMEDNVRRSRDGDSTWTPERLRELLHSQLHGDEIIVVSNREPYIHDRTATGSIEVRRPASGLVTAIEPVMRACSGTWIAHGSGTADREVVDGRDRVSVPPEHPAYALRRIWLSEREEQGFYYGFANERLWPLCHVAHVRPIFRESDWQAYRDVNRRFADAVVAEARSPDPVVLVQDYHFALAPAMIRERLPAATIVTFWHIPWPNHESFGICPWRREVLEGLLGSSILGFHTRFHCRNFMETVDRFLEARIEQEHAIVAVNDRETLVESYPISIEWPDAGACAKTPAQCRREVTAGLGLRADAHIAIGVDRFDYTKGIVERLNAVERLLEKYPAHVGRFVFVQVASPTRSTLDDYRSFRERVESLVDRINARFARPGYVPVHLLAEHHGHDALADLYRAADACVVTSLHDGMNLVSKEFVAARDDERGVLVLSRFAGAARELREALIVNPYHVEETADALHRAITMSDAEQRERMISLRHTVRDANVFRWAGRMLGDAARAPARTGGSPRTEPPGRMTTPDPAPGACADAIAGALARATAPLFALDFDGTLAPIVARPEWARVPDPVVRILQRLCQRYPVAIVTGRKIDDVRHRLGFEPWTIVGSHGAERADDPLFGALIARRLDVARVALLAHAEELSYAGVAIEDKQQSIALHYRRASNPRRAAVTIERCLSGLGATVAWYFGNCVVNIVAHGAPDKVEAVRRLVHDARADALVFAGDDTNDEPVFEVDEVDWHTIRVGSAVQTAAHYAVASPQALSEVLHRLTFTA